MKREQNASNLNLISNGKAGLEHLAGKYKLELLVLLEVMERDTLFRAGAI